jgi:hypothetical protein
MPVRPETWTGVLRVVVLPSPSCPVVFMPQAQTPPDEAWTARSWYWPAAIDRIPLSALTCAGVGCAAWSMLPSPSWPSWLAPHVQTVPSPFSAKP